MTESPSSGKPLAESAFGMEIFNRFAPLNALRLEYRRDLSRKARILEFPAGQRLPGAGESPVYALFLIVGSVALEGISNGPATQRQGGTSAAAQQLPRSGNIRTLTAVQCLALDAAQLDRILSWEQSGAVEVHELDEEHADDWMSRLLLSPTFQRIPPAHLYTLFTRMEPVKVHEGQAIVRQGEPGDYFYVVSEGRCRVVREQPPLAPMPLAELEAGACFGEDALIADSVRNATVTMLTDGLLRRLAKDDFRKLLKEPSTRKLSRAQGQAWVEAGTARWLDVRLPGECQPPMPGVLNLPLYLLRIRLAQLDKSLTYLCRCDTGARSAVAAYILTDKGFDAWVLDPAS